MASLLEDSRKRAEARYPYIKQFSDVAVAPAMVENKGGMGEFVEPDHPSNPVPGKWTITIGQKSHTLQGGAADTIIADMVHAAGEFSPQFRDLKKDLREAMSKEERAFAKRKYEQQYKGKYTGSNFATFENFLDSFWLEGTVQHLLLPENSEIEQIRKNNPKQGPILDEIKKLFEGSPWQKAR